MNKLLLATLLAFSANANAQWEMVPDIEYCIAKNGVSWDGSIGEARFGWYENEIYLSAANLEWELGTSQSNPFSGDVYVDFEGTLIKARLFSLQSNALVVAFPATLDTLALILQDRTIKVVTIDEPRRTIFGLNLTNMKEAVAMVDACNR